MPFNGKLLQTNLSDMQTASDYAFLNALKSAQTWGFFAAPNASITPDMLDANGYLVTMAGNASGGIFTTCLIPSQQAKPGAWIYKWDGNGTVVSQGNCTAVSYTISSVTQSGTIQTVNLSTSPAEMAAGQPIALSGIGGTWAALSNNWSVLDVNAAGNSFRINTGATYTGSATLTSPKATFITTTAAANGSGGLNGSGRYAVNYDATAGGANQASSGCAITNIQSGTDYPHNIRVVHINDEAALDAGGIFTPLFLSTIANFGVIRFLDWQYTTSNQCNVTSWSDRGRAAATPPRARESRLVKAVRATPDERRPNLYANGGTRHYPGGRIRAARPLSTARRVLHGLAWWIARPFIFCLHQGLLSSPTRFLEIPFRWRAIPTLMAIRSSFTRTPTARPFLPVWRLIKPTTFATLLPGPSSYP